MTKQPTPMMQQYQELKSQHPKDILFFRLGDFYEMFFEDALLVSKELELTLTGRAAGNNERAPMCGVPYHSADTYILRLIRKGYRVAICEQLEDPREVKGLVKRGVVRVITPGTILLQEGAHDNIRNYLAYICASETEIVLLLADVSTGECRWGMFPRHDTASLLDALNVYTPSEIILRGDESLAATVSDYVKTHLGGTLVSVDTLPATDISMAEYGGITVQDIPNDVLLRRGLGYLFGYLGDTLRREAGQFTRLVPLRAVDHMVLDSNCLRHLEIIKNLRDGTRQGTLYALLDSTQTAMGSRLLQTWLESPLTDIHAIESRQDAIAGMLEDVRLQNALREKLSQVFDFARIVTRIEMETASPKDIVALRTSLHELPAIQEDMKSASGVLWKELSAKMKLHTEMAAWLDQALTDEAGLLRDGEFIRAGYHDELDELRLLVHDNRRWIRDLEESEKAQTGLKLKIGFNNVFGYYFEIPRSQSDQAPAYFVRKQTLANSERYITPELKEFEVKVLHAQERIVELENRLFREILCRISPQISALQETAAVVAEADVLASLAHVAQERRYIRPEFGSAEQIIIREGRHPMLDAVMKKEIFVPNDTVLKRNECTGMLITGPNMAGKSTYMRQVAVLVLMAQVGSYIPAQSAKLYPLHRIFTRIGASDDISTGQSTFMVEMREVAHILQQSNQDSLLLLDEIGRGTSTYDGMSIARAVMGYISQKIGAFTLFATHYHELTDMEDANPGIRNYTVSVKENQGDIRFLRRIVPGRADRSYGIHVAQLAGLPREVLQDAEKILRTLEVQGGQALKRDSEQNRDEDLFTIGIWNELAELDVMSLSPIEALEILYRLNRQAKERKGL